jgi:hypothetical protein
MVAFHSYISGVICAFVSRRKSYRHTDSTLIRVRRVFQFLGTLNDYDETVYWEPFPATCGVQQAVFLSHSNTGLLCCSRRQSSYHIAIQASCVVAGGSLPIT